MSMKIKIRITGRKVHDVGYRYFLMSMAMSKRIRMFEAHNAEGTEGKEVQVFADGDEEAIKAFRALVETKHPVYSEVSNIVFDDFDGEVMKIGEYAQFCTAVQLNKAIPVLLEIRESTKNTLEEIKVVRKNTDATPQILEEIRVVRKNTDATPQILEEIKVVRKNTDATPQILEEIKCMREDIQPGYANHFRQVQADVKAIKERLGMS